MIKMTIFNLKYIQIIVVLSTKISIITFKRRVNLLSDTFTTTRLVKNTRTVEVCVSFRFDDRLRTERYNFGCSITLRAFFLCLMKEQIIKLLVFLFCHILTRNDGYFGNSSNQILKLCIWIFIF